MKCEICNKEFNTYRKLSYHITAIHNIHVSEYYNLYLRKENEGYCENCGKELPFLKLSKPFNKTCSRKCAGQNATTKLRRESTNIQKFGVKNPFQNEEVKQTINFALVSKYGGYGLGSTIIAKQIKSTCIEKYGVDNPWKSSDIIDNLKQQRIAKIESFEQEYDCTERSKLIEKYGCSWLVIENELDSIWLGSNYKFIKNYEINKIEAFGPKFCRHALNDLEIEIFNFIKSIYNDEIRQNDRKILNGKELDIYIPKLKLGIEIDGDYWHSTQFKEKDFHFKKSELCRKLGIRLVHIQEYIWKNNNRLYKEYLINLFKNINYYEVEEYDQDTIILNYDFGLPEQILDYTLHLFSGPQQLKIPNYIIYNSGKVIYKKSNVIV